MPAPTAKAAARKTATVARKPAASASRSRAASARKTAVVSKTAAPRKLGALPKTAATRNPTAVPKTTPARKTAATWVPANLDQMFEAAAETFRVMSAPMRLKIINALCQQEKNVSELLAEIDTTQPNMSQHLNTLYRSGILDRRRDGVQIYYRIVNERVVTLCRAMCVQIAVDSDLPYL